MARYRFCSKSKQKVAFFTTSCVCGRFLTSPDTTEPDVSRAGIDLQPVAGQAGFGAVRSAAGAAVTHDAVTQDMALAFGVVIFHFHRDNFTDIGDFAH